MLFDDPYLEPYMPELKARGERATRRANELTGSKQSLADFASGHEYYGLHQTDKEWILREWAPNATSIALVGDTNNWQADDTWTYTRVEGSDDWELRVPLAAMEHGQYFRLLVSWEGGQGERLPAYARYVTQDPDTLVFSARVYAPAELFVWKHAHTVSNEAPLIYEAHVGMAGETPEVGSFDHFTEYMLPRIKEAGYTTIQLMGIMEHPYYGSFGYHVSNFFAVSSRFGPPDAFKRLVDTAHGMGLSVIIDLIHSHAVKNELEGLSCFDGTLFQYFHDGPRGDHPAWDSRCFDYGKHQVLHFLFRISASGSTSTGSMDSVSMASPACSMHITDWAPASRTTALTLTMRSTLRRSPI